MFALSLRLVSLCPGGGACAGRDARWDVVLGLLGFGFLLWNVFVAFCIGEDPLSLLLPE